MRMNVENTIGIVFMFIVAGSPVHASDSSISLPENAQTAWISNNLNQSGMVLSIRTFKSSDNVDDVLDYYRKIWFREGKIPGYIEDEMMEWSIISQLRKEANVVLQVKSSDLGGTTGFLSIAKLDGKTQSVDADFPVPDATEEFASTFLRENGADVHTMTFITKQSIGITSGFYKEQLKKQGWLLASDRKISGSNILLFNRRDDRCELVIQELNPEDTVIFANRVQSDG